VPELNTITKSITRPHPAVVVTSFNPLRPEIESALQFEGVSSIRSLAPITPLPFVCILNGEPLLRAEWDRLVAPGDVVVFQVLPQGGGGGGSNPLRIILTIAVIVGAAYFGPILGASLGTALGTTAAVGTALATAGIYLAGNLLVNAIVPPPSLPGGQSGSDIGSPSPTYNISIQGNQARPGQSIPVIYGRHLVYPDFAAQPYFEFDSNNDQYYYALLCIGQGEYDVETIRIDDTPIVYFSDVTTQIVEPGQSQSLVKTNVLTSPEVQGQDMLTNVYVGPFNISQPGTTVTQIGIDVVFPRGLFFANDDGSLGSKTITWRVEYRGVGDTELSFENNYTTLATETFTAADNTQIRRSFLYSVDPGRYQVRIVRTDTRDDNNRAAHDIVWAGLRAYLQGSGVDNSTTTMLAVKIRASEQLSGLSQRRIGVLVNRKLPVYSFGGFTPPTATSSIVWAFYDAITNPIYGGAISPSRVDIDTLVQLDQILEDRGDFFDAVFDSRITLWEALIQIARAGRCVPLMRGGIFTLIRDSQQTLPTALFTMRNIVKNSLSIQYLTTTEESPDGVEIEYYDGTKWANDVVTVPLPGGSTPQNPVKVNIFGVTDGIHAEREAKYIAANSKYRRKVVKFTTEMEGFIPCYGDLIALSHDVPDWGQSGDVLAFDALTNTVTLSEAISFAPSGQSYVIFNKPSGDPHGPYPVIPPPTPTWDDLTGFWEEEEITKFDRLRGDQIVLGDVLDFPLETDLSRERTRFAFGLLHNYYQRLRVVGIAPRTAEQVEIIAVSEDDRVHEADDSLLPEPGVRVTRPGFYGSEILTNYDSESEEKRLRFAFFANDDGKVGTDLDDGYQFTK
jgi:hypothetical protein